MRSVDSEAEPRFGIHAFCFSNHYKFTETCYYSKLHHSEVSEKAFACSCYSLMSVLCLLKLFFFNLVVYLFIGRLYSMSPRKFQMARGGRFRLT